MSEKLTTQELRELNISISNRIELYEHDIKNEALIAKILKYPERIELLKSALININK